ncbi:MAG: lysylphosphatidylglycerol synthase transmembrane domain-containing protein [Flavobacteriaceae bacterium]|jgi:glycosyltransferase 2 family protein|nr:lysylphosphatidylglycerol synthase transmembrane domain-containing protein [Flavobacteriaceae bacterium]
MNKDLLVKIKTFLPLSFGIFLVYYSFQNTSAEDKINILNSITNANYTFVFLSICIGILSHLSRAIRWKYLILPLGYKLNILNSIMSIFAGFLSNFGIPRSGEILRASLIYYYQKIPFEKSFGTIVTERIIDFLILLSCIFLGINISSKIKLPDSFLSSNFILYLILFVAITCLIFILISTKNLRIKVFIFFDGLKQGVLSISKIENKKYFFFHTIFIWTSYFFMLYIVKFSMPETFSLGFEPIFIAFIAGAIAMIITNGGIGSYPLAIASIISQYEVSYEAALAFGWIVWTSQTIMIVILGSLSFVFLPILNKK